MVFKDEKKIRAVIDLKKLANNYNRIKNMVGEAKVAAIIKADGYGHGAVKVAKALQDEKCDFFAVSSIDEALELRDAGIDGTILILGYVLDEYIEYAIVNDISLTVDTLIHLEKIIEVANGRKVKIHIKLDTGMNRTGFNGREEVSPELIKAAQLIKNTENAAFEGIFTHFAMADEPDGDEFSYLQLERLEKTIKELEKMGIKPQMKHICNSFGMLKYADRMHFDAVRAGIVMYGGIDEYPEFEPCMEFITKIINIHEIKKGESASYGLKFTADKDTKVAVIGAGYADGILRCLSCGAGYVLVNGKKAPFLGRICMDMSIVDISDIPDAKIGDDAVLFGYSNGKHLSVGEVARLAGTIPYEILCSVSKRVPRIYK